MQSFYDDQQHRKAGLTAAFIVSGRVAARAQGKPPPLKSVICAEARLPQVLKSFVEVHSKSFYSLQLGKLRNLFRPLNSSLTGSEATPVAELEDRVAITSKYVLEDMEEVRENMEELDLPAVSLAVLRPAEKKAPRAFIKKIVVKKDQRSLREAFAKAEKISQLVKEEVGSPPHPFHCRSSRPRPTSRTRTRRRP